MNIAAVTLERLTYSRALIVHSEHFFELAQKAAMPSRLLPNGTTVTEMGSFITRWSPKHYKSTLINDHRDTFPAKCVTVVKGIIARRPLDANRETVKAIAFNKAHDRFLIKTSAARYGARAALVFVSLRSPTDFLSLPPTSPLPEI